MTCRFPCPGHEGARYVVTREDRPTYFVTVLNTDSLAQAEASRAAHPGSWIYDRHDRKHVEVR